MVTFAKKTWWGRIRQLWSRWTTWGKTLVIFSIPFALAGLSFASVLALPAIITLHYITMIVKNLMDIYEGWKWGNPFASGPRQESQVISENEMCSDDVFVKFPSPVRDNIKTKAVGANKSVARGHSQASAVKPADKKVGELKAVAVEKKEVKAKAPLKSESLKEVKGTGTLKNPEVANRGKSIASSKVNKAADTSSSEKKE